MSGIRLRIGKKLGLRIGLGLGLQPGLIFMSISQTVYMIYRYSADDAEYKSHMGKKYSQSLPVSMVSLDQLNRDF